MFCKKCGTDVGDSKFCPKCGESVYGDQSADEPCYVDQPQKMVNKVAYALLAFFLGGLGIHRFYAGRVERFGKPVQFRRKRSGVNLDLRHLVSG